MNIEGLKKNETWAARFCEGKVAIMKTRCTEWRADGSIADSVEYTRVVDGQAKTATNYFLRSVKGMKITSLEMRLKRLEKLDQLLAMIDEIRRLQ